MTTHTDTQPEESGAPEVKRVPGWAIHRRLYDWVLSFAHRPHAGTALFLISFAESSFFPIPPDVLLGPLCLGNRRKAMYFALITTIASVLGALLGYLIGMWLLEVALYVPGITQERIDWLSSEFDERGDMWVFVAALTPIPFKLLTITAGAAGMNLLTFVAACIVGRGLRFFLVAGIFWWIGPRAVPFIDRYFNLLCVVFTILLVGGFVILKVM
ncbi:MAG: YqaA family protein [Phycisphaerales bacterium]